MLRVFHGLSDLVRSNASRRQCQQGLSCRARRDKHKQPTRGLRIEEQVQQVRRDVFRCPHPSPEVRAIAAEPCIAVASDKVKHATKQWNLRRFNLKRKATRCCDLRGMSQEPEIRSRRCRNGPARPTRSKPQPSLC